MGAVKLEPKVIEAAEKALSKRQRVELLVDRDGNVIAQSIERTRLKIENSSRA